MATSFYEPRGGGAFQLEARGYHVVYRDRQVNHCPGCGRSHWLIGRLMAECAFCDTALPLESAMMTGHQTTRRVSRPYLDEALAA